MIGKVAKRLIPNREAKVAKKLYKYSAAILSVVSMIGLQSGVATMAVYGQTQQPTSSETQKNNDKDNNKKSKEKKKNSDSGSAQSQPDSSDRTKPLSTKEDPSQIGKRNINSGSDKFFGWLGGSKEKEIAIGRQLAMQVEQQVKLVEDPLITEYINRVGQNSRRSMDVTPGRTLVQ